MPPLTITTSATSVDHAHKVDGSVTILQGSYESEGDLKPNYLIRLQITWNGRTVKITSWDDDPSEFSEACIKSAWHEAIRGMAYQSGSGITRYLKEEVQRKEQLEIQVPIIVENLFSTVLDKLKTDMSNLYPKAPRQEAADPIEVEFKANELRAES